MELPKFTANCAKSAQFAHCHHKSRKIHAICVNFRRFSVPTSKIAKISGNSRFGQITQILLAIFRFGPWKMELSKFTANCPKSAQFAHCHRNHTKFTQSVSISQGSLYPWVELSNFMIFVYLCNCVDFSF